MTTAHRATWHPAVAKGDRGGYRDSTSIVSSRDAISHAQLKYRQKKQVEEEILNVPAISIPSNTSITKAIDEKEPKLETNHNISTINDEKSQEDGNLSKDPPAPAPAPAPSTLEQINMDEFNDSDDSTFDNEYSENSQDSDSEDEEKLLLLELEKLKKEEELRKQQEKVDTVDESLSKEESIVASNPLIASRQGLAAPVKRKWYDDNVFKFTTKKDEPQKKRFINDHFRSDFHKSFMKRYFK